MVKIGCKLGHYSTICGPTQMWQLLELTTISCAVFNLANKVIMQYCSTVWLIMGFLFINITQKSASHLQCDEPSPCNSLKVLDQP